MSETDFKPYCNIVSNPPALKSQCYDAMQPQDCSMNPIGGHILKDNVQLYSTECKRITNYIDDYVDAKDREYGESFKETCVCNNKVTSRNENGTEFHQCACYVPDDEFKGKGRVSLGTHKCQPVVRKCCADITKNDSNSYRLCKTSPRDPFMFETGIDCNKDRYSDFLSSAESKILTYKDTKANYCSNKKKYSKDELCKVGSKSRSCYFTKISDECAEDDLTRYFVDCGESFSNSVSNKIECELDKNDYEECFCVNKKKEVKENSIECVCYPVVIKDANATETAVKNVDESNTCGCALWHVKRCSVSNKNINYDPLDCEISSTEKNLSFEDAINCDKNDYNFEFVSDYYDYDDEDLGEFGLKSEPTTSTQQLSQKDRTPPTKMLESPKSKARAKTKTKGERDRKKKKGKDKQTHREGKMSKQQKPVWDDTEEIQRIVQHRKEHLHDTRYPVKQQSQTPSAILPQRPSAGGQTAKLEQSNNFDLTKYLYSGSLIPIGIIGAVLYLLCRRRSRPRYYDFDM